MARKSLNFINSIFSLFKRNRVKQVAQIEEQNTSARQTRRKAKTKEPESTSFFRQRKREYKHGGFRDRGLAAMYFPPRRGKLKGYMRTT